VEVFSPEAVKKIKNRNNQMELINYYGNSEYYLNYSAGEFDKYFKNNQLGFFKAKIVLLGYFATISDSSTGRTEDMFFSPMNQRPKGRSFPDIYGVVIHANILSMIINQDDYITMFPVWVSFLLGACISFLTNALLLYIFKRYKHPYHIWFFISQILLIILVVYLFIKIYDWFQVKMALLPIVLAIVLSVELFDLYKIVAKYFNKKYHYQTIFSGRQANS
jgi:CHASE2 domain-containing sensor protein